MGYSPRGQRESDTIERLSAHTYITPDLISVSVSLFLLYYIYSFVLLDSTFK